MATAQHLSKAPITEALIDIRATLPQRTREIAHLAALGEQYREQYPNKKDIHEIHYRVEFGSSPTDKKSSAQIGFRYTSAENAQVIQATLNGFTFSRLPPYQDWNRLRAEARSAWGIYANHVRPENITRVAARYINKLVFPGPHVDFDRYLNYVPVVPKVLPQALGGFFSRVVVPDEKAQCVAIITQMFQPSFSSEIATILDIDVFREKVFTDEEEVWSTIEALRAFKNQIFFDSITEATVDLYK